jgi:glycosyltransferase involved in cell wall biosynthesis
MKRPIVATDVRGCREAVDNEETGILVPRKNAGKLAEAILWMLDHPTEAAMMGKRGREKVEREFDENIVFERIEREYGRLVQ